MDELTQLMDELTLALKKRAEVGAKTEKLAQEVRELPNLSVVAPDQKNGGAEELVNQLYYRIQIQNLVHAKQEALNALHDAVGVVSHIRQTVNDIAGQSDEREAELVEEYTERIRREQDSFAELQEGKRDLLFNLSQKLHLLRDLERSAAELEQAARPQGQAKKMNGTAINGHCDLHR